MERKDTLRGDAGLIPCHCFHLRIKITIMKKLFCWLGFHSYIEWDIPNMWICQHCDTTTPSELLPWYTKNRP